MYSYSKAFQDLVHDTVPVRGEGGRSLDTRVRIVTGNIARMPL